jgi:hypothetical protein
MAGRREALRMDNGPGLGGWFASAATLLRMAS